MNQDRISQIISQLDSDLIEECIPEQPSERIDMTKHTRRSISRKTAALILAACLVLALGITAYASGAIQSWISSYYESITYIVPDEQKRQEHPDYAQYIDDRIAEQQMMQTIGEMSEKTDQSVDIPEYDGLGITMLESYYDGGKIAMSCRFRNPHWEPDFTFGESSPEYAQLEELDEGDYRRDAWRWCCSEEEQADIEGRLTRDGSVSFIVTEAALSDHVYLNGEDLGPCHGDVAENGIFLVEPFVNEYGDLEFPESARGLDSVEATLKVYVYRTAYRLDGDRVFCTRLSLDEYPMVFTLKNLGDAQ